MEPKIYTVYKTTNILNNRYYVGVHKTSDIYDKYLGSGLALKSALRKYGRDNFRKEIIATFSEEKDAYDFEREYVNISFLENKETYNMVVGGVRTIEWSEERKSKVKSGPDHPFFGKKHSEISKARISKSLTGKIHTTEARQKISESNRRRVGPNKGKKLSTEDRLKKSVAALNRVKIECPFCLKSIDPGNAKMWHFDNCKLNPTSSRYSEQLDA